MLKTYKCKANLELMEVDQEWLVMDVENYTITKMNPMGALVLEGIKAQKGIDEIVASIHSSYEVDEQVARADVSAFLEQLEGIGLITDEGL